MECWTDVFNAYLSKSNKAMPLEPEEFKNLIYKWVTETQEGQMARSSNHVGFIGEDLVYTKIKSRSKGGPQDPYA